MFGVLQQQKRRNRLVLTSIWCFRQVVQAQGDWGKVEVAHKRPLSLVSNLSELVLCVYVTKTFKMGIHIAYFTNFVAVKDQTTVCQRK